MTQNEAKATITPWRYVKFMTVDVIVVKLIIGIFVFTGTTKSEAGFYFTTLENK